MVPLLCFHVCMGNPKFQFVHQNSWEGSPVPAVQFMPSSQAEPEPYLWCHSLAVAPSWRKRELFPSYLAIPDKYKVWIQCHILPYVKIKLHSYCSIFHFHLKANVEINCSDMNSNVSFSCRLLTLFCKIDSYLANWSMLVAIPLWLVG